jgi:hypothetical protein
MTTASYSGWMIPRSTESDASLIGARIFFMRGRTSSMVSRIRAADGEFAALPRVGPGPVRNRSAPLSARRVVCCAKASACCSRLSASASARLLQPGGVALGLVDGPLAVLARGGHVAEGVAHLLGWLGALVEQARTGDPHAGLIAVQRLLSVAPHLRLDPTASSGQHVVDIHRRDLAAQGAGDGVLDQNRHVGLCRTGRGGRLRSGTERWPRAG